MCVCVQGLSAWRRASRTRPCACALRAAACARAANRQRRVRREGRREAVVHASMLRSFVPFLVRLHSQRPVLSPALQTRLCLRCCDSGGHSRWLPESRSCDGRRRPASLQYSCVRVRQFRRSSLTTHRRGGGRAPGSRALVRVWQPPCACVRRCAAQLADGGRFQGDIASHDRHARGRRATEWRQKSKVRGVASAVREARSRQPQPPRGGALRPRRREPASWPQTKK
jgi:hypothetical protein